MKTISAHSDGRIFDGYCESKDCPECKRYDLYSSKRILEMLKEKREDINKDITENAINKTKWVEIKAEK